MAVDIEKMREALALTERIDALMSEAGAYDADEGAGLASAFSLKTLIEDLDIDIERIESGDVE